jgi:hypothetical protein
MPTCSFCMVDDDDRTYVQGEGAFICSECVKVIHDMVVTKGIRTQKDLQQVGEPPKTAPKTVKGFKADRFYFIGVAKVQDSFGSELQGISNQPLYVLENTDTGEAIGIYGDENLKSAEVISSPGSSVSDVISSWIELAGRDDFNYVTSYEEGDTFVFELIQAAKDQDSSDFESEFEKEVHILSGDELVSEDTLAAHSGKVGFWVQSRADLEINFDEKARKLTIGADAYKDIGTAVNEVLMGNSDTQVVALIEESAGSHAWGRHSAESDGGKKAVRAVIDVSVTTSFRKSVDFTEGSFYIAAIECDEVSLVSNQVGADAISLDSEKPVISGEFWEESLNYDYGASSQKGAIEVRVTGPFAFELSDYASLDGYDVDDGPVVQIVLAWAASGDDPKILGATNSFHGGLSECEEDEDFVEL